MPGRSQTISIITVIPVLLTTAGAAAHHPRPSAKLAASASPAAAAVTGTPTSTVIAFHEALAQGDTAAALSLLAENALIFESGGVETGRAEYASSHLAADAEFSAAVRRTLIDRSVEERGDIAWVTTIETVIGTFRNRPVNNRSLETMTLRRAGGRWRIAHIHWSSAKLP